MNIGAMDREIIVERNTPTISTNGAELASWATLVSLWAEKRAVSGRETFQNTDRLISSETASFYTHYYSGITTKDRIKEGAKYWNIRYVREIGRGEGLELLAEVVE
jgi:SPP1 family predicted phage head-tail adaptor